VLALLGLVAGIALCIYLSTLLDPPDPRESKQAAAMVRHRRNLLGRAVGLRKDDGIEIGMRVNDAVEAAVEMCRREGAWGLAQVIEQQMLYERDVRRAQICQLGETDERSKLHHTLFPARQLIERANEAMRQAGKPVDPKPLQTVSEAEAEVAALAKKGGA